jgi:dsDNA-binding SOS-regulon protein
VPIPLFRRVSADARKQYAADRELADAYDDRLDAADEALDRLRTASARARDAEQLRTLRLAAENALLDAIRAAEAGERATAGVETYGDRIAFRRARARSDVDLWSKRMVDLRTRREALKLHNQTTPGTLVPGAVRVTNTAAYGPHVFGLEALPGTLREGVDLGATVDREGSGGAR